MRLDASDITDLQPIITAAVQTALHEIAKGDALTKLFGQRLAYTCEEAALLLGMNPATLAAERRAGNIVAKRAGKRWFFSHSSLVKFLDR